MGMCTINLSLQIALQTRSSCDVNETLNSRDILFFSSEESLDNMNIAVAV